MRNLKRKTALAAATACLLIAAFGAAQAAGALAVARLRRLWLRL